MFLERKKKTSPGAFRWTQPRSPLWRRFILLSVAIFTKICVNSSCCFSALLIIILFYGPSWIYFLLPVNFVYYVSSSLYKVNSGFPTEAIEHSCLKKIPFALFKIRKNMNEVRLCNILHLMATVSIVLLVV